MLLPLHSSSGLDANRDAYLYPKETRTQNSREKPLRFPTGIFQTQKLEVDYTNFQDFADLSTMAVSIVLILNRANFLYPSKMAQKSVLPGSQTLASEPAEPKLEVVYTNFSPISMVNNLG